MGRDSIIPMIEPLSASTCGDIENESGVVHRRGIGKRIQKLRYLKGLRQLNANEEE